MPPTAPFVGAAAAQTISNYVISLSDIVLITFKFSEYDFFNTSYAILKNIVEKIEPDRTKPNMFRYVLSCVDFDWLVNWLVKLISVRASLILHNVLIASKQLRADPSRSEQFCSFGVRPAYLVIPYGPPPTPNHRLLSAVYLGITATPVLPEQLLFVFVVFKRKQSS